MTYLKFHWVVDMRSAGQNILLEGTCTPARRQGEGVICSGSGQHIEFQHGYRSITDL